jgi:hypothetical protein
MFEVISLGLKILPGFIGTFTLRIGGVDPATLLVATLILAFVALISGMLPAIRARDSIPSRPCDTSSDYPISSGGFNLRKFR